MISIFASDSLRFASASGNESMQILKTAKTFAIDSPQFASYSKKLQLQYAFYLPRLASYK